LKGFLRLFNVTLILLFLGYRGVRERRSNKEKSFMTIEKVSFADDSYHSKFNDSISE
jgi:hypothetical protein